MNTLLLICSDAGLSDNIIQDMGSKYDVWHVTRERDAMAWLQIHRPDSIVMDLDLLGNSAADVLDQIQAEATENCTFAIGICQSPETIPALLLNRLDQLIVNHSI